MTKPQYYNHSTAYFGFVRKSIAGKKSVLDVGCGDGALLSYLDDGEKKLTGIDPDISHADRRGSAEYIAGDFLAHDFECKYDAITFVASLHHMDMDRALAKAKSLLNAGGMIVVIGIADPSSFADRLVEVLRVVPSFVISKIKRIKHTEENGVAVSYVFPTMDEVRSTVRRTLPGAKIKYGLHFRYLLVWKNSSNITEDHND